MLSEDERKSIQLLTKKVDNWNCKRPKNPLIFSGIVDEIDTENNAIRTVLNLITKLQKENEKKDKEIKKLKQNIDYQVLCDFLISSVSNEEPVWTEKHIEELLENFEMRWKNAYK